MLTVEELIKMSEEERKKAVDSLEGKDLQDLVADINNNIKKTESELVRLETIKEKLNEDKNKIMESINSQGINSKEELEKEISALRESTNKLIVEYTNAISNTNI